jgi:hypothetical protein
VVDVVDGHHRLLASASGSGSGSGSLARIRLWFHASQRSGMLTVTAPHIENRGKGKEDVCRYYRWATLTRHIPDMGGVDVDNCLV